MPTSSSAASITPVKKEAVDDKTPIKFAYDGDDYNVPPSSEWDLDAMEQFEEGHGTLLMKALLGPSQWQKFRENHSTVKQLDDMYSAMTAAIGTGN